MLLIKLKDYIKLHKQVPLAELERHFRLPRSQVEAMLQIWIRKGIVQKKEFSLPSPGNCCESRHCAGCTMPRTTEDKTTSSILVYCGETN
ncbi:MAG: FeoC-like transcriptional regulator [Neisseriaceae bacterium]